VQHKPYSLLRPLPVATQPWTAIQMDFIEKLPPSFGYNAILVIVNRMSKQVIFIPCHNNITSAQLAELFVIHVFSKHGVPTDVTSNRGLEFVSAFFRALGKALNMNLRFTLGYHLQANGGTEHVNQTLEVYLQMYCDYQQDNWKDLLPLAEFAYNNSVHAATSTTPFFANKRYHPLWNIEAERALYSIPAWKYAASFKEAQNQVLIHLEETRERMKEQADTKRIVAPNFLVGSKAYINAKYFKITQPAKKLSNKYNGPWEVLKHVGPVSVLMALPPYMSKIHPVFHVSMLEPAIPNPIPGRVPKPPPPIIIDEEEETDIKQIVNSHLDLCYANPLYYTVKFLGYKTAPNNIWYMVFNNSVLDCADEVKEVFHARYPDKPGPAE
jgi:hypothetical protein